MNKDREIQELQRYNSRYLDCINALEQRLETLEKQMEFNKKQCADELLDLQDRLHVIEMTLKQYHIT